MGNEYGEFVGVDSLYYALHTTDTDAAFEMGVPVYLAPVADIAGTPKIANKTTYYDNKAANNYVTEGETELKMTVSNVPAQKAATLLGKHFDAVSGRVYDSGEPNPPDVAVAFRYNMGKNGYRYFWYLKGTFSGGVEEATSKKEDVDIKTYQLTFTAVTTTHQWTINGELKSLKRIFADTSDSAFDPTGWFTQVQTPDVVGAPPALTLVSTIPTDNDFAGSRTAPIVLTFSNAIASEAVTVLSVNDGLVPVTKSFDTARKVLSIAHPEFGTTLDYIVSIAGVVDTYGQSLETTSIKFVTMAI